MNKERKKATAILAPVLGPEINKLEQFQEIVLDATVREKL